MVKYMFISFYIASAVYCYWQINSMVERCMSLFKERHPIILVDEPIGWGRIKAICEMIAVSAIPILNLLVGYLASTIDESAISEIVKNVELDYWREIRDAEKDFNEKLNDLDKYF